jgi:hypothetical protein
MLQGNHIARYRRNGLKLVIAGAIISGYIPVIGGIGLVYGSALHLNKQDLIPNVKAGGARNRKTIRT